MEHIYTHMEKPYTVIEKCVMPVDTINWKVAKIITRSMIRQQTTLHASVEKVGEYITSTQSIIRVQDMQK